MGGAQTWEAKRACSEHKHPFTAFGGLALLIACLVVGITGTLHELPKLTESSPSASQAFSITERQSAFQAADQLFVASAHFAAERGLTVAALSAPQPIGPAEMASIRQRRMLADQTLARAEQHLLQIRRSTIRERVLSRIVVAQGRVTSLRAGIDREATKPVEQRVQPVISQSLETPTALIGGMAELLRAIHSELGRSDRGLSDWLEVQRLTWEMAEYAGRERAQFAAFLANAGSSTRAHLVSADRNHLQAVFAWKLVQSTMERLTPPQHLIEQTKIVEQRYFADQEKLRRSLLGASQEATTRELTVPQWFQGATLSIDAMIEFGRKAGGVAAERSTANS